MKIHLLCIYVLMCVVILGTPVVFIQAQTTSAVDKESLMYQINMLLARVASLQVLLAEKQGVGTSITGTPTITLEEPKPFSTVTEGAPYTVRWSAKNIPPGVMVLTEIRSVFLDSGSGAGGGTHQALIAPGNSSSTRLNQTGVGYIGGGTFEVRLVLVKCLEVLCTSRPYSVDSQGKTVYDGAVLAKTDWTRFSVTKKSATSNSSGVQIEAIQPNGGVYPYGTEMEISFTIEGLTSRDHRTCVTLVSSTGKYFTTATNSQSSCQPAVNGKNSQRFTPVYTPGFKLTPGLYKVTVDVMNVPNDSGKDVGTIASASGSWFTLSNN
jgi:hypothetical protein